MKSIATLSLYMEVLKWIPIRNVEEQSKTNYQFDVNNTSAQLCNWAISFLRRVFKLLLSKDECQGDIDIFDNEDNEKLGRSGSNWADYIYDMQWKLLKGVLF